MKRIATWMLLMAMVAGTSSCAIVRRDRCYLAETRYLAMRAIFESTGSYQRVAQAMDDEQWSHCEINTFRYRLRKDLMMDSKEYDILFQEYEPSRQRLDVNPGRVERAVQ